MRIMFVVNIDWFFVSHRLPLALAAMRAGHEVHLATTITLPKGQLESYGFTVHDLVIDRSGFGVWDTLKLFCSFLRLFWRVKPDIAHLVTIKPVLVGGLASRVSPVRGVVFAISGLGHVFIADGLMGRIRRKLVSFWYRLALGKSNKRVIFQNPDDCALIQNAARLPSSCIVTIPGSGVDLSEYAFRPAPSGRTTILMVARLLKTKGVIEFVESARLVVKRHPNVCFLLAGSPDHDNPSSVDDALLEKWKEEGIVSLLGHRSDVSDLMREANIVVLPSYYGEGLPKVLIEAAACGRAVVTTDMPGCRDAIEVGVTGVLVPPKDSEALASALLRLLENPKLYIEMGYAARKRAEAIFDINSVVHTHIKAYEDLI